MSLRPDEFWSVTAVHEAGHGVVAIDQGMEVVRLRLFPGNVPQGPFGEYEVRGIGPRPADTELRLIRVALAGQVAEQVFAGDPGDGGDQDDDGAFELALRLTKDHPLREHKAAELLEREWAEVERILRRPKEWRAVLAIAGRLLDRGEVSGRGCEKLYRRFVW